VAVMRRSSHAGQAGTAHAARSVYAAVTVQSAMHQCLRRCANHPLLT
jgi:hypothetical protein